MPDTPSHVDDVTTPTTLSSCPPGSIAVHQGNRLLVLAPPRHDTVGSVPVYSAALGLFEAPGDTQVTCAWPDTVELADAVRWLYTRLTDEHQRAVDTADRLQVAQANLADQAREFHATKLAIRARAVHQYQTGREICLPGLSRFLSEFGMPPVTTTVRFVLQGSYETTSAPDDAADEATCLQVDTSMITDVDPDTVNLSTVSVDVD